VSDQKRDLELGMKAPIRRRDFLNGFGLTMGAALAMPHEIWGEGFGMPHVPADAAGAAYYPPAKTGLRGSHDGSWEVAHEMRDGRKWDEGGQDSERYDLIVVGGGISGLSAAYFYRKHSPKAKILILDNHDDFGGHAKRNEFQSGGRLLIGYGGTQTIAGPALYSAEAKNMFKELGIETDRFNKYFDQSFFSSRNLNHATFFDKETFGVDRLVKDRGKIPWPDYLAKTPLSEAAQKDIARLFTDKVDYLPTMNPAQKKVYLARTSYKDFLLKNVKVSPEVIPFFQKSTYGLYGVGIDAVPAGDLAGLGFHPGFGGMDLSGPPGPGIGLEITRQHSQEPYIHHFPDGNASVARLLVRALIPSAAPGDTMEDIVLAKMDYLKLDQAASSIRIRLNATVVHAVNVGGPEQAKETKITYIRDGKATTVRGRACVLACWNMAIPYMCPEMSDKQKEGLAYGVKVPLVYTNVQLGNWKAFDNLKISGAECPGSFFEGFTLDFPVSMGGYKYPEKPEDPCVIHLEHVPTEPGLAARDQQRAGRMKLYTTKFETFERNVRDQLGRALSAGGFDPAKDIEAITVNRWPHGYAYEYNSLYDPEWPAGQSPCEIGRQPFGRIHIANSDAGAFAYTNEAIDQAWRAVQEIAASKG